MNIVYRLLIQIVCLFILLTASPIEASNDLSVDFGKTGSKPFFNFTNMAPGEEVTKSFTVYNDDRIKKNLTIKGLLRYESGNLSKVLDISIKQDNRRMYGFRTLKQFFEDSNTHGVLLSEIQPRSKNFYQMTVRFQHHAGNAFQNKRVSFDIQIGSSKKGRW
jgi:hypothetical protein